jgi:hypothetical protein
VMILSDPLRSFQSMGLTEEARTDLALQRDVQSASPALSQTSRTFQLRRPAFVLACPWLH